MTDKEITARLLAKSYNTIAKERGEFKDFFNAIHKAATAEITHSARISKILDILIQYKR